MFKHKIIEEINPVDETPILEQEEAATEVVEPQEEPEIEVIDEEIKNVDENYRECTCGTIVPLPDGSAEEFTICEGCGIKHIR